MKIAAAFIAGALLSAPAATIGTAGGLPHLQKIIATCDDGSSQGPGIVEIDDGDVDLDGDKPFLLTIDAKASAAAVDCLVGEIESLAP